MRRHSFVFAALALSFSSLAFSQGRTIEETLVVTDPTVAAQGKWKVGGAAEYWWVRTSYKLVDSSGNEVGDANLSFKQPGWNIFGAYGNLTVQATRRSGDGDYTANAGTLQYSGPQKSTDEEYTLRWLFPSRAISPYVMAGYAKTRLDQTYDIATTSPFFWTCTGNKHLESRTDFSRLSPPFRQAIHPGATHATLRPRRHPTSLPHPDQPTHACAIHRVRPHSPSA